MSLITQTVLGVYVNKVIGAFRSKVIWLNAVFLAMVPWADEIIAKLAQLSTELPALQPYVPDNIYKAVGTIAVIANLILRFKTRVPLEVK